MHKWVGGIYKSQVKKTKKQEIGIKSATMDRVLNVCAFECVFYRDGLSDGLVRRVVAVTGC